MDPTARAWLLGRGRSPHQWRSPQRPDSA